MTLLLFTAASDCDVAFETFRASPTWPPFLRADYITVIRTYRRFQIVRVRDGTRQLNEL